MEFFNFQACKFLSGNFYLSSCEPSKTETKLKEAAAEIGRLRERWTSPPPHLREAASS